jgi:hypothetical protein
MDGAVKARVQLPPTTPRLDRKGLKVQRLFVASSQKVLSSCHGQATTSRRVAAVIVHKEMAQVCSVMTRESFPSAAPMPAVINQLRSHARIPFVIKATHNMASRIILESL